MNVAAVMRWGSWARLTLTAAIAFVAAIATAAVFVRDVERQAASAERDVRVLAPRVEALEREAAANAARFDAIRESLVRIESKVDRR